MQVTGYRSGHRLQATGHRSGHRSGYRPQVTGHRSGHSSVKAVSEVLGRLHFNTAAFCGTKREQQAAIFKGDGRPI